MCLFKKKSTCPKSCPSPTFSDALSCTGGPDPGRDGGGGARRFFTSDLTDMPEMLLSERDGPSVTEREFTDGELGVVKQPCWETDRHMSSLDTPTLSLQMLSHAHRPPWSVHGRAGLASGGKPHIFRENHRRRCHMTGACCKTGSSTSAHQQTSGEKSCGAFTQWSVTWP